MNPAQMQKMMSQMGIKTIDIPVEKALFYLKDGTVLELNSPQVVKMTIQGTETYQVVGHANVLESKAKELEITEEDVKMVSEQANVSKEQAKKALEETQGDIAEAILKLK
jgi:nascent polypeptide-associated complex subunit alpha